METIENLGAAAQRYIDRDDQLIHDVAADCGQIVDNVKHMRWFLRAVASEIALRSPKYGHLLKQVKNL